MKCQVGLLAMTTVPRAAAGIILQDMMTEVLSASDVITAKAALIDQCEEMKKTMGDVISLCQTTSDTTSATKPSSGSDAFTWTYQQLSSTEWFGLQEISNSYSKWGIAGKLETSEDSGLTRLGSATRPATSTSAYTCMIREAFQKLNQAIDLAEAERRQQGL